MRTGFLQTSRPLDIGRFVKAGAQFNRAVTLEKMGLRERAAKAFEALPSGGALIVFEALIDDDRRQNAFGLLMSLNMLIETPGGFDYTGADCTGWMSEAGFSQTRAEHLIGPDSMVIGIK